MEIGFVHIGTSISLISIIGFVYWFASWKTANDIRDKTLDEKIDEKSEIQQQNFLAINHKIDKLFSFYDDIKKTIHHVDKNVNVIITERKHLDERITRIEKHLNGKIQS